MSSTSSYEDSERTVACDSRPPAARVYPWVPPLQCESMNITSEESCFDFVGKRNYYCNMGSVALAALVVALM